MLLSLCYLLLRRVLPLTLWRWRSTDVTELEIAVLRHELAILRRQAKRPAMTAVEPACRDYGHFYTGTQGNPDTAKARPDGSPPVPDPATVSIISSECERMLIVERKVRGVTILDLTGRFVLEDGVTQFVELMNALTRQGRRRILVNFENVTYLDSAGVGAVAWKYVTVRKHGGDVKLLNLRPRSFNVLEKTKLLTVLESFESEDQAIDTFTENVEDDDIDPIFT